MDKIVEWVGDYGHEEGVLDLLQFIETLDGFFKSAWSRKSRVPVDARLVEQVPAVGNDVDIGA